MKRILLAGAALLALSTGAFAQQQVRVGQTVNGDLREGDTQLSSGEFSDTYEITGRAGQVVTVRMTSPAFDPYLMMRGPEGFTQDNDDVSQGVRDAELVVTLPANGRYRIIATSFAKGESGRYTLAITGANAGTPAASVPAPVTAAAAATISPGMRVNGDLARGDRQLSTGEFADHYTLEGRAGQHIELRLESGAFDPFVQINGPGNFTEANDDDPSGGRGSRLGVTLPADGRYSVMVTSYAANEVGAYTLRVGDAETTEAMREPERPRTGAPISTRPAAAGTSRLTIGENTTGQLARGDEQLGGDGEYVDTYRFTGTRGQRVAIDATSTAFDTYLMLQPPEGAQIDNDDGPSGTNARIDQVLPADGEYRVLVTSFRAGETGDYQLSIAPSEGSARIASVLGGQRVFALMVGVSDYGDTANNLPNTDEDARKLADALRRAGVLNPASIVLTNAEGTRDGVRSAFARVAAQAGPDDMFLFFYSGHGNQVDITASSATEPDARDEEITLRDGGLSDDELAGLFGTLRTRLSLAVLDSCYSGGFARDIVNRPGVMGIFSSEEDLTSLVAEKFEAGGYLSYFIRSALSGDADDNGDRIVSAGELATYLRTNFNSPAVGPLEAETTDGQRNYQNLVIERGGVQVDDVIVRLGAGDNRERSERTNSAPATNADLGKMLLRSAVKL
ncbi:MAG: pre-peptidase C-terminal domain-containing protein [Pseudomonadota bacterium]